MKVKRKKRVYQEGESGWGGFLVKEGINLSMFLYMLLVTRQQRERGQMKKGEMGGNRVKHPLEGHRTQNTEGGTAEAPRCPVTRGKS